MTTNRVLLLEFGLLLSLPLEEHVEEEEEAGDVPVEQERKVKPLSSPLIIKEAIRCVI